MLINPYRKQSDVHFCPAAPFPIADAQVPLALLARCPQYARTPLLQRNLDGVQFFIKDERQRMGLGSFKALGAAFVIAELAQRQNMAAMTFVTASAGNHGLSVAAGARVFGAKAVIYLSQTVPESFAVRLQNAGAEVRRAGDDYEESAAAAILAAAENNWTLLSDSSWAGYVDLPRRIMEGYLVAAAETAEQMECAPEAIFLQAGVGGLASAFAAFFRVVWGDAPQIYVVEPEAAPALHNAIEVGKVVTASGPASIMGRLDCKEPSLIALNGLARDADGFILVSDEEVAAMLPELTRADCETTPSGGAGMVAALLKKAPPATRVLCVLSETA